jgi:hypothetical protein
MRTSLGVGFRIGSKTLVELLEEQRTEIFEVGTTYFEIKVGDKTIKCFAEKGTIDDMASGKRIHAPKFTNYIKKQETKKKDGRTS